MAGDAARDPTLTAEQALGLLTDGELAVTGRLVDASNATLFGTVTLGTAVAACVYKPVRGERPLWDFPDGTLAAREHAAYLLSEVAGFGIVPPTVLRDGPFGQGMCQLWIDIDDTVDVVELIRCDDPRLRPMALFDAVINNADRKGGHLLPVPSGWVYGVDHGLCFHAEDKLRTVLWGWQGERLDPAELAQLDALAAAVASGPLAEALSWQLSRREQAALARRVELLARRGCFPHPSGGWPPVPWPPF